MSRPTVEPLTSTKASLDALREVVEWAQQIDFAYAWIDTGSERSKLWHMLDESKIHRGVVGLHFDGTDPAALEFFHDVIPGRVRVLRQSEGTFHPKVIVGSRGSARRTIIGSSNLTPHGFGANTEVNVLVSGHAEDAFFRDLHLTLAACWFDGFDIEAGFLREYRRRWQRRPRPPTQPVPNVRQRRGPKTRSDLDIGWPEYVGLLRAQVHRHIHVISRDPARATYIAESEAARKLLRAAGSFKKLSYEDARFVSGFGPGVGYFGSTTPNGLFKKMVREKPSAVARLIDPVASSGPVADDVVRAVFDHAGTLPRVGIGIVTRLLTVKRPDLFFPVNNANRRRIREIFGSTPSDATSYLELVHAVRRLPWARSPRPQDPHERRLWDARVGLLDAVVYDPA